MAKSKDVYILYVCDEWKSHSSMRSMCVSTSFDNIVAAIRKLNEALMKKS